MSTLSDISKKFRCIVIKIGGRPVTDQECMRTLADEIGQLLRAGIQVVLVHGGGSRVTALSSLLGVQARFTDGVRITGPQDMKIADQVLAGEMNTELVRLFHKQGIPGVGLNGCDAGLCTAKAVIEHTGSVAAVNPEILHILHESGILPIVASVSQDSLGRPMNINADEFARGIAEGLKASALVYISDIPGVIIHGSVASELNPGLIEQAIEEDEIREGMIAKTRSAVSGIQEGIGTVCIGDYAVSGQLLDLLTGKRGTHIGTF